MLNAYSNRLLTWTTFKTGDENLIPRADYYAFSRIQHSLEQLESADSWDVFISSYDETERVRLPFEKVSATHKEWIVHEEYGLPESARPEGAFVLNSSFDPPEIYDFVRDRSELLTESSLCIDSTGFIRPHLLVLLWALQEIGVSSFDVLYSDPTRYIEDENTQFTSGPVTRVAQVPGYEGFHPPSRTRNDLLVIGAGYDDEQIRRACEDKPSSRKYILTGLPSLQPHMYQESELRLELANEWTGEIPRRRRLYASANHPFAVAQSLHDLVDGEDLENIYLCPVGPKPHVLGFAIYYLRELKNKPASIIYPFVENYSSLTSEGHRRTWQYKIEL